MRWAPVACHERDGPEACMTTNKLGWALAAGLFTATGSLPATGQVPAAAPSSAKDLRVYFADVEGGQATLFVTPDGESLLVDTGNPGARDSDRIAALAKHAGITKIDNLVITHYHSDH